MRLKTLELQGFKSFPDKTVLNIENGITIVVGPNGCGKSNIADAMKWVLGDTSSKSLRGESMEDVIFAGSEKRSPMNYASVTVTFDTSDEDGKLPGYEDFDEISVTRRFYRQGEGEYLINKKAVRRKDIISLFMNTGIGKNGYSIIGQGKIAEIISTKSSDRRKVLEEAAGIAKYRNQKDESEKKLFATQDNLSRVEDIEKELESRIPGLEKDSEKARKYLDLMTDKKQIDISLSAYDIKNVKEECVTLEDQLSSEKYRLENDDNTLEDLNRQYEEKFEKFQDKKRLIENNLEEINRINNIVYENETKISNVALSNEFLEKQKEEAKEKIDNEKAFCDKLQNDYSNKSFEVSESDEKLESIRQKLAQTKEDEEKTSDLKQQSETELEELKERFESIKNYDVETQVELSAANTKNESNSGKIEELNVQKKKITDDIEFLEKTINQCNQRINSYMQNIAETERTLDLISSEKAKKQSELDSVVDKRNEYSLEISTINHKVSNLEKMDELFEGYSRSVRFVLSELKNGNMDITPGVKPSIVGPISSVIKVDTKYATALEIALGSQLQNIIVDDEQTAKYAISYLKKHNGGRATFYPADTMKGSPLDDKTANPKNIDGYISIASSLIECDDKYRGIINYILGRTIIVDDIENATLIAKSIDYKYKLVSLDGQVINAGGSYTGGSTINESGLLSRKATCDKLKEDAKVLTKSLEKEEAKIRVKEKELADIVTKEKNTNARLSLTNSLVSAEKTKSEDLEVSVSKDREEIALLEEQMSAFMLLVQKDADSKEKLEEKRKEYEQLLVTIGNDIQNKQTECEKIANDLDKLREEYNSLTHASLDEEKSNALAKQTLDTIKSNLDSHLSELNRNIEIFETSKTKIETNIEDTQDSQDLIKEYKDKVKNLSDEKDEASDESIMLEKRVNEIQATIKSVQSRRDLEFQSVTRIENALTKAQEQYSKLVDFLWEEYEITYTDAQQSSTIEINEQNRKEYHETQVKLKNQVRALGNVNVNSIEEYKEVKQRYDDLSVQTKDLRKSREELLLAINKLEENMKTEFSDSISVINENFNVVLKELFGGGDAGIVLSNEGDILNCDIDIKVTLPGKKITSLSLLSGGEQAFVAIALYFAMFKVNPSPFCILDEIEAALDENNVAKFASYVKRFTDKTQFVIITHRRGTMLAADTIYGVTMHEKGITDVIPVKLSEIEEKIGVELK